MFSDKSSASATPGVTVPLTKRVQLRILLHGVIVLFMALLSGMPYGLAITRGWGAEAVRAWRLTHLSLLVGAILLIAIAGVSHLLALNARAASALVWSFAGSVYVLGLGLVLAAVTGVRGLDAGGPAVNSVVFYLNLVGVIGSFIGVALMGVGVRAAWRNATGPELQSRK